ncbi:MFS general substrate transporter [Hesseltinella vesiculosa]|uniref:MFS general substrate transporter n=1 Tax=Hesseltinella vesiculosa TaxID=101127 RepID=A0A1X2GK31_9FUNG|nr:MFS general substrate transporter [Hesseltinella vesiculosa]
MLGQLFCAFGQPFILNAATPYASLWFGPNERSSAGMAGGLANTVGMAVADLIVPAIVLEQSQMEMNFLIIACVTTACAIPTFFVPRQPLTPPSFSASNRDERRQSLLTSLRELLTNYNFLIIFFSFGTMVGMASTLTTMLAQIVEPYGISYDEAGYLGVAFIVAGIVGAVTTGIFVDRTKQHVWVLRIYVPIIGFLFLAFYFVVKLDDYAALAAVCAILGFFMFSLLPVALDLSVESSYPVTETISSSSLWMCSQVLGLIWLVAFDSLFDVNGNPPNNLNRAVILAVCVTMPMMILSTLYNSPNRRMEVEKEQQRLS